MSLYKRRRRALDKLSAHIIELSAYRALTVIVAVTTMLSAKNELTALAGGGARH